jgi:hypothetical protein
MTSAAGDYSYATFDVHRSGMPGSADPRPSALSTLVLGTSHLLQTRALTTDRAASYSPSSEVTKRPPMDRLRAARRPGSMRPLGAIAVSSSRFPRRSAGLECDRWDIVTRIASRSRRARYLLPNQGFDRMPRSSVLYRSSKTERTIALTSVVGWQATYPPTWKMISTIASGIRLRVKTASRFLCNHAGSPGFTIFLVTANPP